MELVQKQRFDEASIDAWRNQTTHILQQALGEQSYGYYAGAFWNWQTHAITSDDEDEIEQERLADVMRAFPIAMDSLTAAIETLEKLASVKARESSSAQAAEFQAVELLDDQKELLVELVRAEHSVPKERRHKFVVSETMNNPPTVIHEGLPGGLTTTIGDIESLADARMLRTGESSRGGLLTSPLVGSTMCSGSESRSESHPCAFPTTCVGTLAPTRSRNNTNRPIENGPRPKPLSGVSIQQVN
jgi:hypothetical protein